MMLRNEQDIIRLIEEDEWMMKILKTVKKLELPDWWISAGFIRSKIWDTLHGFESRTPLPDVDVIYFNSSNLDEKEEKGFEEQLLDLAHGIGWSVKNQARMHKINGFPPYKSSVDGISHFPEIVTAIGAKLDANDKVILTAPHGVSDLINLQVKPSPPFQTNDRISVYRKRVKQKNWESTWNKLVIHHILDE